MPFAVPEPNPFLASDFSLYDPSPVAASISVPTKIHCTEEGFSLWYRPDSKFRIPKAVLNFYLVTPLSTDCARKYENGKHRLCFKLINYLLFCSAVLLEILAKMLKHQLMEKVYDALVAQLELAIHHYDRGLVIKVSGFNHKLHVIIIAK